MLSLETQDQTGGVCVVCRGLYCYYITTVSAGGNACLRRGGGGGMWDGTPSVVVKDVKLG